VADRHIDREKERQTERGIDSLRSRERDWKKKEKYKER
jgi:hypothetical protein